MTRFVNVLVQSLSAKGLLLDELALIENIQIWIITMSSAANRPFRHTSTVIALEVISAFCTLGRDLVDNRARILQQAEGEKKNKRVNHVRVKEMLSQAQAAAERKSQLDSIIKDWFDVVFVHRYRDIDPRIRVDCVTYLSDWIWTYPEVFLDGQHLRYLGWVLSDTSAPTRLEVSKQLQRIFKDDSKTAGLRQFTERFRPRMVEMATRDGDANVRCATVDLLNIIRDKGLLEPDDIDSVGQLIFDVDPKIRKAVAPFFVTNVEDTFDAKIGEYDSEMLQDFISATTDSAEGVKVAWIRFKVVAELLHAYGTTERFDSPSTKADIVRGFLPMSDSSMSIAARDVVDRMPAIWKWEHLAAFLATDHSDTIPEDGDDIERRIRQECKLSEREEIILLNVLNAVVHQMLAEVVDAGALKKGKKTKAQMQNLKERQESAAQKLAEWIPRLLKKFGTIAEATSAVLRLEHVLRMDVFQELREDSTTYAALLEDINRQFLSHDSPSVLDEAKVALLHAQSIEELHDITDGKLQALWDDTTLMLARLCRGEDMASRGNLHVSALSAMSSTVLRLATLASIADCTTALQMPVVVASNNPRRKSADTPIVVPIEYLVDIVGRGVPGTPTDEETEAAEESLVSTTLGCILFFFMWRITDLRSTNPPSMEARSLTKFLEYYDKVCTRLVNIITARHGADLLRLQAVGMLLDLKTLFSTLKSQHAVANALKRIDSDVDDLSRLTPTQQRLVIRAFIAAEHHFAETAGKTFPVDTGETQAEAATGALNDMSDSESADPAQDPTLADPASSDDEDEDGSDGDDVDPENAMEGESTHRRREARHKRKQRAMLLAERSLCTLTGKIILALVGKTVPDDEAMTARLQKNAARLGANFKDVVRMLDVGESAEAKRGASGKNVTNGVASARKTNATDPAADMRSEENSQNQDDDAVAEEDGEQDLRNRELLLDEPSDQDDEGMKPQASSAEAEVESLLGD